MSSSDESVDARLAECIYPLTTTMCKSNQNAAVPPSNRVLPEESKHFDYRTLRVPDKLREHMQKNLDKLLSTTQFISKTPKNWKKKSKKQKGKILLLKDSLTALDADQVNVLHVPTVSNRVKKGISEAERDKRCKQVAVSGEFVLSQREVKHWAPENRGKVEVIDSLRAQR